jgi:hypothetical protein
MNTSARATRSRSSSPPSACCRSNTTLRLPRFTPAHSAPMLPDPMAQQSHAVAASRLLDLHHVGAEVGEQRAGPRPGHHLARLDDGETLQRPWHGVAP